MVKNLSKFIYKEAAKAVEASPDTIKNACRLGNKIKGYYWEFMDEEDQEKFDSKKAQKVIKRKIEDKEEDEGVQIIFGAYVVIDGVEHKNYTITDDGRVWGETQKKYLKCVDHGGYKRVKICKGKKGDYHDVSVHRLVAQAFIPNPKNFPFVNHKNGIRSDNRVENLEWVTHKQNIQHSCDNGSKVCKPVIQYDKEANKVGEFVSCSAADRYMGLTQGRIAIACRKNILLSGYYWKFK
jgi:hypothetical protein